jgi:hypothetical protein
MFDASTDENLLLQSPLSTSISYPLAPGGVLKVVKKADRCIIPV